MSDDVVKSWIVENTWTCSSCQLVNKGRDLACTSCGNPKEKDEKDIIHPEAPPVTDPTLLAQASQAPHWVCEYCQSTQRDSEGHCTACGGGKTKDPNWDRHAPPKKKKVDRLPSISVPLPSTPIAPKFPRAGALTIAAGILGAILFGVWLFSPRKLEARVTSMHWSHLVKYEERTIRHGEGWGAPLDSFNDSCSTRLSGYHDCDPYQCNPHLEPYDCNSYKCNCSTHTSCRNLKNGYSKCDEIRSCSTCYHTCTRTAYSRCYHQCPTYSQWCSYDFYRWEARGERTLTGNDGVVAWPDMGVEDTTHRALKVASYIVNFQERENSFSVDPNTTADFQRYAVGQRWRCEKAIIGFFKPLDKVGD